MSNIDAGSNTLVNFFQNSADLKIKDISASRFFDIIGENSRLSKYFLLFEIMKKIESSFF